ncbi:hypothetical protein AB6Q56_11915 [Dechloromonas sp. ARDL1]|uniref:hypothetical protein n=1 Tax=Dechloromonas sp. ARDL1 TaxID=3322121 RepID=UPI003DA70134
MNDKLNSLANALVGMQTDGNVFTHEFLPTAQIDLVEKLNRAALHHQYPATIQDNQSSRFSVVSTDLYGEYMAFRNFRPEGQGYAYCDWLLWRLAVLYQEASGEEYLMVVMDQVLAVEGQLSVLYGIDTSPNSPLWDVINLMYLPPSDKHNCIAKEVVFLSFNQAEVA